MELPEEVLEFLQVELVECLVSFQKHIVLRFASFYHSERLKVEGGVFPYSVYLSSDLLHVLLELFSVHVEVLQLFQLQLVL